MSLNETYHIYVYINSYVFQNGNYYISKLTAIDISTVATIYPERQPREGCSVL